MNVYTINMTDAWIDSEVTAMIGHSRGRNQAPVFIAAPSKAAAHRLANDLPNRWVGSPTLGKLHLATGRDFEALTAAGLFEEQGIIVKAHDGGREAVVRVTTDGPTLIGHCVPQRNGGDVFEHVGTLHPTLSPDALAALRELLARVPESQDRQDLLGRLPAELLGDNPA